MSRTLIPPLALAAAFGLAQPAQAQQAAPRPNAEIARLLESARMWLNKNRADVARGVLTKALLIDPDQPDTLAMLGELDIRSNRAAEAGKALQQMRRQHPGHPATQQLAEAYRIATSGKQQMARVRLLARAGKSEEAVAGLLQLFPDGAPRGDLADEYYRILAETPPGRTRALAELRQRASQAPDAPGVDLTLGRLLIRRGPTRQEGLAKLNRVLARPDGDRATALSLWKGALLDAGEDPAYLRWFERYAQERPDDEDAARTLATVRQKEAAHRKMLADPAYQAGQRGLAQLDRGNLEDAEALLETAYQKRRDDPDVVGGLGLVRLREGRHDEARALFERAMQLDADNRGKWRSLAATAGYWGKIAKAREANAQGKPAQAEALAREALAQQPGNASARMVLADALIAQDKRADAEAVLRGMLAGPEPDIDALRTLARLLNDSGRADQVGPLIASTSARLKGSNAELRKLRAELLSVQADQLIAERKQGPALARLEEAITLQPDDAWTRFTLARLYRDLGLPALGRAVMTDGLAAAPGGEMRYAAALYLNSVDDIDAASQALAAVPEAERSEGMRDLAASLSAQRLLRDARLRMAEGREDAAAALLRQAAADAKDDPQMLASIGREWIAQGQPDTGLRLVDDWFDTHPDDPAIAVRLRYGDLLAAAGRDEALRAWIADASARPGVTAEQRAAFEDQMLRAHLREVDRSLAEGEPDDAERTLYAVPQAQQGDRRWLLALADVREARRDFTGAADAARKVLETQPKDADARLMAARMLEQQGREAEALDTVRAVLADTPPGDVDTRLSVARRLMAMQREDEAQEVVTPLARRYPERSDIVMQQGRIDESRGNFEQAAQQYQRARMLEQREDDPPGPEGTPAERALRALGERRQGQVATAVLFSNKSGDPGVSRLNATEIPLYVRIPHGYTGHVFFHADTVLLDAGTLPAGARAQVRNYAKFAVPSPDAVQPIAQSDRGVALAAGYEFNGSNYAWRADLGTTPLGFTRQNVVGGFQLRADMGALGASIDVSRRPVTSSLVSYAGAVAPAYTDATDGVRHPAESWGGVVRNGINMHVGRDVGRGDIYLNLGLGIYTGHNVLTNREVTVRTGFDYPLLVRPNQQVNSGLALNYWSYSENQRYYTFGHGGYYSPQHYFSVSVPLEWLGRKGMLSWRLMGSLGYSNTYEKSVDFFPTDAALQKAAGNPTYGGGSGGGLSYTLGGSVEYRFAPKWVVGAVFSIDRSHDYAPNRALIYLRYFFDRQTGPVSFPTPVRPYSAY